MGLRLRQVYKAVLRDTGEEVAVKVQRPNVEPLIFRDLYIFRQLARFVTPFAMRKLGCNAELIVDEFGEKLLEELDYAQEARNIDVSVVRKLYYWMCTLCKRVCGSSC